MVRLLALMEARIDSRDEDEEHDNGNEYHRLLAVFGEMRLSRPGRSARCVGGEVGAVRRPSSCGSRYSPLPRDARSWQRRRAQASPRHQAISSVTVPPLITTNMHGPLIPFSKQFA